LEAFIKSIIVLSSLYALNSASRMGCANLYSK